MIVGRLRVLGKSPSRVNGQLLQITTTVGPYRFHRIRIAALTDVQVFVRHNGIESPQYDFISDDCFVKLVHENGKFYELG